MKPKSPSKSLIALCAIVFCLAFFLTFMLGFSSSAQPRPDGIDVPNVSATKTAALASGGDADGDGRVDSGYILEYTVTINHTCSVGLGRRI